jgi:hypothetical protein
VAARAMWMGAFGATAMTATLGAPAVTYTYALANILPGVLVLACAHDRLGAILRLSPRAERLRTATLVLTLVMLYKLRLWSDTFPLAPLGLLALAAMVALLGARARRPG